MTTLKIERKKGFLCAFRDYKIYIDGQHIGSVSNGSTKEFSINSGQHIITAKIDLCHSPNITVNAELNETINLCVSSIKSEQFVFLFVILMILIVASLSAMTGLGVYAHLLYLIVLPILYYVNLSIGEYLSLTDKAIKRL